MLLSKIPKIELHLHLDCSLSYPAASQLSAGLSQSEYDEKFPLPEKCKGLADFLSRVPNILNLLQTEAGLRMAVNDLFHQLKADNVIYAEIRFAPLLHLEEGLAAEEVVEIVTDAFDKAEQETGITAGIILCTLRHFTEAQGMQTIKLVEKYRDKSVVALDLAADEAGFPLDAHKAAFRYAMAHDIPRIAHAGEAKGPESVWETLNALQPSRIGHGVRSIEDPMLMEYLRNHGIHLEICPTCNVQIDVFASYETHPIDRLYKAGISVGINTDGRTLPQVTLTQEYEKLKNTFGWENSDFLNCNMNALRAAFLPENKRKSLLSQLQQATAS